MSVRRHVGSDLARPRLQVYVPLKLTSMKPRQGVYIRPIFDDITCPYY